MKKTALGLIGVLFASNFCSTTDSVQVQRKNDTIRIGGMIILKKGEPNEKKRVTVTVGNRQHEKKSNINTSSFIVDLGFSNWVDKTDYASATADGLFGK